jgi:hypothetical protein
MVLAAGTKQCRTGITSATLLTDTCTILTATIVTITVP